MKDKRVAIYPGSFNPYHEGHDDVVRKALRVFNKVILAIGVNPEKDPYDADVRVLQLKQRQAYGVNNGCIEVVSFEGLLADYVNKVNEHDYKINAVIRGLRNGQDFEFEKTQQYWNEDLKIGIPTVYFISSRNLTHVSSSALRTIDKLSKK